MNEQELNKSRLFNASSLALAVTALTFAIRANLLGTLGDEFNLSPTEIGQSAAAAFWGFTIAMFIGGPLCDLIGLKRMFAIAFLGHVSGIILTTISTDFWTLFASTLLVGLGNGFIESASYAMVSSLFPDQKTKKINDWHIWFPAGIMIGGILSYILGLVEVNWKWQMMIMLPPTLVYGWMFLGQRFPLSERVKKGVTNQEMVKECFRPLFILMIFCMLLTGATELGTNQWIAELLSTVGVPSILLLVFINGIMTIGRANAGFILKRISTPGLLLLSASLSFLGLLWLGFAQGYVAFAAAGVFAAGVCFFWPTMIGFVSEYLPKTGPLGLSLMGGVGLLSTSLILPYFGQVYEWQLVRNTQAIGGSEGALVWSQIKLTAGAKTLLYTSILPAILLVAFSVLYFIQRPRNRRLQEAIADEKR